MSVEVVSGVRIVQCHAIIDDVIDVGVMQCHASMDVVIGVRVVLCHQAIDNSGFSTSCPNSSSCQQAVSIHHHREKTSFEVWYLHTASVTVDRRQL